MAAWPKKNVVSALAVWRQNNKNKNVTYWLWGLVSLEQTKKPEDTCQPTNIVHHNICDMSKYNDCIHVKGMYYDIYIYTSRYATISVVPMSRSVLPGCSCFTTNMTLMREHFPRLGYNGPTNWMLLSLYTPFHLYSLNDDFMLFSLYLTIFLYSNDVSPSKIPPGAAPVPTACQYCLASLLCSYVV